MFAIFVVVIFLPIKDLTHKVTDKVLPHKTPGEENKIESFRELYITFKKTVEKNQLRKTFDPVLTEFQILLKIQNIQLFEAVQADKLNRL